MLGSGLFLMLGQCGQVDGQSHVVHSEEEALGTRLTIDSLTCLLANETDPSKLLAISPGKLMRYLVPDESYVLAEQPYAEIEVLPLTSSPFMRWCPSDVACYPPRPGGISTSSELICAADHQLELSAAQRSCLHVL